MCPSKKEETHLCFNFQLQWRVKNPIQLIYRSSGLWEGKKQFLDFRKISQSQGIYAPMCIGGKKKRVKKPWLNGFSLNLHFFWWSWEKIPVSSHRTGLETSWYGKILQFGITIASLRELPQVSKQLYSKSSIFENEKIFLGSREQ